jgi:hypothetical protein
LAGSAGLHELAHYWLGREQPYDPANLNTLMFDNLPPDIQTAALLNPNSNVWKLTPNQIGSLFQRCERLHPHPQQSGGSGTFGGGGGYAALWWEQWWWLNGGGKQQGQQQPPGEIGYGPSPPSH